MAQLNFRRQITCSRSILLAAAIMLAPLGVQAADLVVWWKEGFYPQEDEAVAEVIAAFEQGSGKQVELVLYPQADFPDETLGALEAGQPPGFAFHLWLLDYLQQ